jgi:hypothetical protein
MWGTVAGGRAMTMRPSFPKRRTMSGVVLIVLLSVCLL